MNTPLNPQSEPLTAEMLRDDPGAWLPGLSTLLDEQCGLCVELETLSQQQSQAVKVGDTDLLLRVLGRRQPVVDRVTRINAMLEPFRAQKEPLLGRLAPVQRDAVVQRVGRIAALVESVRARDDADRAVLEKQRANVAEELAGLARGRGAAAAYSGAARYGAGTMTTDSGMARFQDRKG